MTSAPLIFEFDNAESARLAYDTLQELEYRPEYGQGGQMPTIRLTIDRNDLTSALEITQAYGGTLQEEDQAGRRSEEHYSQAYELDRLSLPAHVVTEDFTEAYLNPYAGAGEPEDGDEEWDLTNDDYNYFSGDVRL